MVRFKFGKEYYGEPITVKDPETGEERIEYVTKERDAIYEGARAVKGENYIHLYDATGIKIASFDGISDFSGYKLLEGEWSEPDKPIDTGITTSDLVKLQLIRYGID